MTPEDRVVIERVHLVVAGPGPFHPDRFESRHPGGKRRPDEGVEGGVFDLERRLVRIQVFGR